MDEKLLERAKKYAKDKGMDFDSLSKIDQNTIINRVSTKSSNISTSSTSSTSTNNDRPSMNAEQMKHFPKSKGVNPELIERARKLYGNNEEFDSLSNVDRNWLIIRMLQKSLNDDDEDSKSVAKKTKKKSFWDKVSDSLSSFSESTGDVNSSFTKNCVHCFTTIPGDSKFCNNCGKQSEF